MPDIWIVFVFQFNFTYPYIDDVLAINNPDFETRSDASTCAGVQRHDREQHFCFLLGQAPIDREGYLLRTFLTTNVTISISISQNSRS